MYVSVALPRNYSHFPRGKFRLGVHLLDILLVSCQCLKSIRLVDSHIAGRISAYMILDTIFVKLKKQKVETLPHFSLTLLTTSPLGPHLCQVCFAIT